VNTKVFTGHKWGTKNPIMLRDPEFGPTRLRAFGSFAVKVSDPGLFVKSVAGTGSRFTVEGIGEQLRDMLVARFADALGEAKIPVLDLAANQDELGSKLAGRISEDFAPFGLQVVALMVENISLPPEVEAALDKRTSMGVIGDLNRYTQFQTADAIKDAAKNPGGLAGAGVGMGMGVGMGAQVAQAMGAGMQGGVATPPPLPQQVTFFVGVDGKQAGPFDLATLQRMVAEGSLKRETLVWRQGMGTWTKAGEVGELAGVFGSVPPPLPG
jgi:membrane protease subunit (stomatin/prohibitin family)